MGHGGRQDQSRHSFFVFLIIFNFLIFVSFFFLTSLLTKTKNTVVKEKENFSTRRMYGAINNSEATPLFHILLMRALYNKTIINEEKMK